MDEPVKNRRFMDEPLYTSTDVCRAAGVSYRQLDWWDRQGVVCPTLPARGSGTQRGYTLAEAQAACLVGVITSHTARLPCGALGAILSGAEVVLVVPSEGTRAHLDPFDGDDERILDAVRAATGPLLVVDVGHARDRVARALLAREPVSA